MKLYRMFRRLSLGCGNQLIELQGFRGSRPTTQKLATENEPIANRRVRVTDSLRHESKNKGMKRLQVEVMLEIPPLGSSQNTSVPSFFVCPHGLSFPGSGRYFRPQTGQIRRGGPAVSLSYGFLGACWSGKRERSIIADSVPVYCRVFVAGVCASNNFFLAWPPPQLADDYDSCR